jgi:DNA (cytosine-5)-methyltransferase 1
VAAYYNENDRKTAAWLRELIKAGLIADGEVDERSITDVRPGDLRWFRQCHFFAGIGGWSYALRLAGWPDDRHVWTGSCPCQPWSMAGEGKGTDDPRHLWPTWFRLIAECRPAIVFGEQTASLDGLYWLDLVYADLEASNYALGAADLSGACFGSPDIRPRLWFVADTDRAELSGLAHAGTEPLHGRVRSDACGLGHTDRERCEGEPVRLQQRGPQQAVSETAGGGATSGLADTKHAERRPFLFHGEDGQQRADAGRQEAHGEPGACGEVCGLADSHGERLAQRRSDGRIQPGAMDTRAGQAAERRGLLGGFWADCEWIYCRPEPRYPEGCYRPVEPGSFPLVAGVPARILRLRGYGNSIKPHVAADFIQAYCEARGLAA